ncbi:MAG: hypothetical protein K2K75_05730 [Muribaculaceae bacterium]|nr:hypothetical protein [Muribaculaceae bacterium]
MKRIFSLLAVCLVGLSAIAQNAGITLSYNKGKELKFFRSNQLMEAIDAAEINDTLYFSAGSFDFYQLPQINDDYYAREWSKPLVVIGAGAQDESGTSVSMPGTLFLKFDETIPVSQRNVSFEGIYIPNWVSPACEVNNLSFINFRGDFYDRNNLIKNEYDEEDWVKPHTYINNVVFDRCLMDHINLEERNVNQIQVINSKVSEVSGQCSEKDGKTFTLDHSRIRELGGGFIGLVQNSAIHYDYSGEGSQINASGMYSSSNSSVRDSKCVTLDDFYWIGDEMLTSNDGSVTLADGTMMGTLPSFSLYPSYPTLDLKESEIDYDGINGKVAITVKLLGGK